MEDTTTVTITEGAVIVPVGIGRKGMTDDEGYQVISFMFGMTHRCDRSFGQHCRESKMTTHTVSLLVLTLYLMDY